MPSIEQIRSRLSDLDPPESAPSARRASVAIVLAGDSDACSVCFVERARRDGDPWSGDVAFPGGWAKHEAESLREAAMRETHEEIGLSLADANHVGDVAPMQIPRIRSGLGIIGASVFYVGESRPALSSGSNGRSPMHSGCRSPISTTPTTEPWCTGRVPVRPGLAPPSRSTGA